MVTFQRRALASPRWFSSLLSHFTGRSEPVEPAQGAGVERRLSYRLTDYWEARRGDRPFPSLADIDPEELADIWPWCFILDVEESHLFPFFHHLGRDLARYSGIFLAGEQDWMSTLLDKATASFADVLETRGPVLMQNELTRFDRRTLLFRAILLPLSDDGRTINYVIGAANGKMIED